MVCASPITKPNSPFSTLFFSDRSRFGHAIPGSARGVSGAFGVSSVLCYTGVSFVSWVCSRFLRWGFGRYRYHQCFFICGLFTGGYAEFGYDLVVGWTV
ncbi:uncharacterized protein K441DRAFT_201517 [Cenococcum geophilum 1.58]|uniref:uncharacterized protein n=1 Tax=Cenococcum geophilum 1.58 TaxID=794803 RepID=UPI00358F7854|nr:hypothetical protein K441DRAFT_201517 [Cenococcum geophilum 1.58]